MRKNLEIIIMKAYRTLLLTLITIIFCSFTVDAYNITAEKTDAKTVRVKAEEFYLGDNDNVAAFSFYFDNVSARCNLMVATCNKTGLLGKPISVIFYMADGTKLIFGGVKSDDYAIFLLDFLNCVSSDFKGNYENASLSARNVCGLNKLSTVNIKTIVVNNVKVPVTTQTAATFKQIIQKGISMLSDKSSYAGFLSGKSSSQSSTTKKNQTSRTKQSPKKKTVKKDAPKKVASDPQLLKLIRKPGGMDFGDLTLATPESLRSCLNKYGIPFKEHYDIGEFWFNGRDYRFNLGGEPADMHLTLFLREVSYEYSTKKMTRQNALNLYDELLKTLRASGVDIKEDPSDSFVKYAVGKFENRRITFTVINFSEDYHVSLSIDIERQYSKSDYEVSVDLFESLGSNVYGITGLKISDSFDDIKTAVLNQLSPVDISENSISTRTDISKRQLIFEIPNNMDFKGLKSSYICIYDLSGTNACKIGLATSQNPNSKKIYDYDEARKIVYSLVIDLLKQKNPKMKKCSKNIFKKTKLDGKLDKIKEIWSIDRGTHTDYYILTKDHIYGIVFLSVAK